MEELKVYVREKPTEKYDWNTRTVQFENGKKQYQQTWTSPEVTCTFTTTGLTEYINEIIDFYNDRKGMLETFYCDVFRDGNKKIYRFGSTLEPQWFYDVKGKKIGATLDITLIKVKE